MGWADEGWDAVLERWERQLIEMHGAHEHGLRRPAATEADVAELEQRIGRRLPPSYRTFLLATNGANARAWTWAWWPFDAPHFDGFLPAARVLLMRRRGPFALVAADADEYDRLFNIGGKVASHLLEPGEFERQGHLIHVLVLNGEERQSNIFLDPLDVDADGEWRAWNFHGEDCGYYWSFGDLMDEMVATMAEYEEPERRFAPGAVGEELAALDAALNAGGPGADTALARLRELATTSPSLTRAAIWILLGSENPSASELVLRLVEEHPDDTLIIGNAIDKGIARSHNPRLRPVLEGALAGPNGTRYATNLAGQWPELVDEAWRRNGDPMLLKELLNARRPGTLTPVIRALADPDLSLETRNWLTYTLSHAVAEHPDSPQPDAVVELAAVPANDRLNLAMALLHWGEVDRAMAVAGEALDHPSPTGAQIFSALAKMKPPAAVPALVASLRRVPSSNVLHTLSAIDHQDSAPEIAKHLDGDLRFDALIALEQLANPAALDILAEHAAAGDLDATRALARHRDARALQPLMKHLSGPARRSAVTGLRDLRHPQSAHALTEIAVSDRDDDLAVIAAQGLVMMDPSLARPAVEVLRGRDDPDIVRLAQHWLERLPAGA